MATRGLLRGRTLAGFWRDADGSMVLGVVVLSVFGWVVVGFPCVFFCFLPAAPPALLLAMAGCARLATAGGRHRRLAIVVGVLDVLPLIVLAAAIVMLAVGPPER